jgi:hypothetical protein
MNSCNLQVGDRHPKLGPQPPALLVISDRQDHRLWNAARLGKLGRIGASVAVLVAEASADSAS